MIQLDPDSVSSVDDLRKLPVGTAVKAPLDTVAAVEEIDVQGSITRIDGAPAAQVTAEISSPDTGAVSIAVQQEIDLLEAAGQIPAGIDVTLAGTQQQTEAFSGPFVSMAVAVLLVYVMMVLAFNSLVTPFIILFSLPLAMIGAVPCALPHRPADRRERPHRDADAHRHRRDERDRPARPGRAVAARGPLDARCADRGWQDPRPADPMTAIATILR